MLNNIDFVAVHVFVRCTKPSLAISSQGRLVKFDSILMLLIGFLV